MLYVCYVWIIAPASILSLTLTRDERRCGGRAATGGTAAAGQDGSQAGVD